MKYFIFIIFFFAFFSCKERAKKHTTVILENDKVNADFFDNIDRPEKALLSWYLYAYGNECDATSSKAKCKILELLHVKDECADEHIRFLKKWFDKDVMAQMKLKNCPVLAVDDAIQNKYKAIILSRNRDTLSIHFKVWGLNESQEKNWNVDKIDSFLIENEAFVVIN
ncbi:MAG TPA: hypothetical protein ENJ53_00310 [Phaeodactylibacter sp.]|nr:hypothetical protein [Phaeodactylibacter sp.]